MTPNDENGKLPTEQRPFRVLVISGSDRRQYNCPGVDSKSRTLMLRMAERLPREWEIDYEDLGNVYQREHIQSCNACVSTSMALCVYPCNCYERGSQAEPDLMFDRLVCANGGNPREDLIEHKNAELAMKLEHSPEWEELSLNQLEGRTAGFFCYGDGGGDELDESGRPKILRHQQYFDPEQEPFENNRDSYAPLVWQCRYGGIEVPDHLWRYVEFGRGKKYSDNQAEHMAVETAVFREFDEWTAQFAAFVREKGKVEPGKYRAYGYEAPGHLWRDLKLKWREVQIGFGAPPEGSSPARQQELGLNQDATLFPKKGEGEKLRE